jgi:hypothetical protein
LFAEQKDGNTEKKSEKKQALVKKTFFFFLEMSGLELLF